MAEFDEDRIEPIILEVQRTIIRPLLSDALYSDVVTNFDNSDSQYNKYRELINGKNYTKNGYTVIFDGLKYCFSYHVLAALVVMNPLNFVRYGIVKKTNPNSEALTETEMQLAINALKTNAKIYQNNLVSFLEDNVATYPLYNYKGSQDSALVNQPSFYLGKL